jgi:hypothetical protein
VRNARRQAAHRLQFLAVVCFQLPMFPIRGTDEGHHRPDHQIVATNPPRAVFTDETFPVFASERLLDNVRVLATLQARHDRPFLLGIGRPVAPGRVQKGIVRQGFERNSARLLF